MSVNWPAIFNSAQKFIEVKADKAYHFNKAVKYSDGIWTYESDSESGIRVVLKCPCGKVHTLKLGDCMNIGLKEEVIDIDVEGEENDTISSETSGS